MRQGFSGLAPQRLLLFWWVEGGEEQSTEYRGNYSRDHNGSLTQLVQEGKGTSTRSLYGVYLLIVIVTYPQGVL